MDSVIHSSINFLKSHKDIRQHGFDPMPPPIHSRKYIMLIKGINFHKTGILLLKADFFGGETFAEYCRPMWLFSFSFICLPLKRDENEYKSTLSSMATEKSRCGDLYKQ